MVPDLPLITIIIPNYNGKHLLERNLPDVCKAAEFFDAKCAAQHNQVDFQNQEARVVGIDTTTNKPETQIIVVDDASTETGAKAVVKGFAGLRYIQHTRNQGFAGAVFTGIESANTEFVLLLNSDVSPSLTSIAPLVAALHTEHSFAASPLILSEDGTVNSYSWNHYYWSGTTLGRNKLTQSELAAFESHTIPHLFCSGGSVMLQRAKFLALGGFATLYKPYYSEDLDLGVRAWYRGWSSVFVPESKVTHQIDGAISQNENADQVKTIQRRNRFYFEWSHLSITQIGLRTVFWLRQLIGRTFRGDMIYIKGLYLALRGLRSVWRHRRNIRQDSPMQDLNAVLKIIAESQNEQTH